MPASEVLDRAADLVSTVGLHRGELWPGGDEGKPYVAGSPVCALGAVCAVRGATTGDEAIMLIASDDPALAALRRAADTHLADIAWLSDSTGRWIPFAPLAAWWGSRAVTALLRRAARVARRG